MNEYPLVSIVIPLFNSQEYISETINSVIAQTYSNWELIVVDDCSTDNSRAIVSEFSNNDKRVRLIELKENHGGPAGPRNIGVKKSRGKYVAFLDSDDIWVENKLSKQISYMEENKINFSSSDFMEIDSNGGNINKLHVNRSIMLRTINKKKIESLIKFNFIFTSSVVIRKDFIHDFNEDVEMFPVGEDYLLWLELFNKTDINYCYFPDRFYKYRILESSISERHIRDKALGVWLLCVSIFIHKNKRYDLLRFVFINFTIGLASLLSHRILKK